MAEPPPDWASPDGTVTLYCGDCRDIIPRIRHGQIDMVVTDPPYGIGHPCDYARRGRGGLAACHDYPDVRGDKEPFDPAHLLELELPLILWGGNHYASRLPDSGGWLVWDKERPDLLDQATCELAWTNCIKGVRRFRHLWNGCMRASERGESYHPTQKPVELMLWCLALPWVAQHETILDPFMGSGPTGVACVRANRRFCGIEYEPRYFDIACERMRREIDQRDGRGPLFEEEPADG